MALSGMPMLHENHHEHNAYGRKNETEDAHEVITTGLKGPVRRRGLAEQAIPQDTIIDEGLGHHVAVAADVLDLIQIILLGADLPLARGRGHGQNRLKRRRSLENRRTFCASESRLSSTGLISLSPDCHSRYSSGLERSELRIR